MIPARISPVPDPALPAAIATVPPGRWAVGVSGGPDSVALLSLLVRERPGNVAPHVVHLDHQLRGDASTEDARFVAQLASQFKVPCTIARRDQIEPGVAGLPTNPSARYRRLRLALFADVVRAHALDGVILAHHADDQAETVLHRLLRSSGPIGLTGMRTTTQMGDLTVTRPLLGVRRSQLLDYLREIGQPWRTDASNESPEYLRNRVRALLSRRPQLIEQLIDLGARCGGLREWLERTAPVLDECFPIARLADPPDLLARVAASRWLRDHGSPPDELMPEVLDRLITMSRDAATGSRQHFPGKLLVGRRGGMMFIER